MEKIQKRKCMKLCRKVHRSNRCSSNFFVWTTPHANYFQLKTNQNRKSFCSNGNSFGAHVYLCIVEHSFCRGAPHLKAAKNKLFDLNYFVLPDFLHSIFIRCFSVLKFSSDSLCFFYCFFTQLYFCSLMKELVEYWLNLNVLDRRIMFGWLELCVVTVDTIGEYFAINLFFSAVRLL